MRKMNKKNKLLLLALLVVFIGVGYAFLSANLSITGTTNIGAVNWNVEFQNPTATQEATVEPSSPLTIDGDTLSYTVPLDVPGDVYEFTVDVANTGSIDAMISDFVTSFKIENGEETVYDGTNLPEYLEYSVKYASGTDIEPNHELKANTTETIKVRVALDANISEQQFQQLIGQTVQFNVKLDYAQLDDSVATQTGNQP